MEGLVQNLDLACAVSLYITHQPNLNNIYFHLLPAAVSQTLVADYAFPVVAGELPPVVPLPSAANLP